MSDDRLISQLRIQREPKFLIQPFKHLNEMLSKYFSWTKEQKTSKTIITANENISYVEISVGFQAMIVDLLGFGVSFVEEITERGEQADKVWQVQGDEACS